MGKLTEKTWIHTTLLLRPDNSAKNELQVESASGKSEESENNNAFFWNCKDTNFVDYSEKGNMTRKKNNHNWCTKSHFSRR